VLNNAALAILVVSGNFSYP
jgi:hypothetical protein